jgi:hypothetical protein
MLPLDPIKLAIIALVALVVLGPDKLPAAARKVASVWSEVRNLQSSLQREVSGLVSELPLVDSVPASLPDAPGELIGRARSFLNGPTDPRQALYRSIGLSEADDGVTDGALAGSLAGPVDSPVDAPVDGAARGRGTDSGPGTDDPVPASIPILVPRSPGLAGTMTFGDPGAN